VPVWGWIAIGALAVVASWAMLVLLAARLPEGTLKELAGFLPDCATTARRLRGDPRVPRRAKVAVGFALLWVLSPIDLIPEFLPVIGPVDDVVVVALALRYAARQVPRDVLLEAWPGKPSTIERLLGSRTFDQTTVEADEDETRPFPRS
jgi:uncharacterized membrane protein YkvA (DUF1232 family)